MSLIEEEPDWLISFASEHEKQEAGHIDSFTQEKGVIDLSSIVEEEYPKFHIVQRKPVEAEFLKFHILQHRSTNIAAHDDSATAKSKDEATTSYRTPGIIKWVTAEIEETIKLCNQHQRLMENHATRFSSSINHSNNHHDALFQIDRIQKLQSATELEKKSISQVPMAIVATAETSSCIDSNSRTLGMSPSELVKKIKDFPPLVDFADALFVLCVIAACTGRNLMMEYMDSEFKHLFFYDTLQSYLSNHFMERNMLSINSLCLIGNLLLCGLPNWYCSNAVIKRYRRSLQAQNIDFDKKNYFFCQQENKKMYKDTVDGRHGSRKSAKLCGWIMCHLMIACLKGRRDRLPNVEFLYDHVESLTQEQKDTFVKCTM